MLQAVNGLKKIHAQALISILFHRNDGNTMRIKERLTLLVSTLCLAVSAVADPVAGTSVILTPPSGYETSPRVPGYVSTSTAASIVVTELPGNYEQILAGVTDGNGLKARDLTLVDKSDVQIGGNPAVLLRIDQKLKGTLLKKWIAVVNRGPSTVLIVATWPDANKDQEGLLKQSILSSTFGKPHDPTDALSFTIQPMSPFQIATVVGQTLILSPEGRFPVKDEDTPFMVVGLSPAHAAKIDDQKAFAERRIMDVKAAKRISVDQSEPIEVHGLKGYRTLAHGMGTIADTPMKIHQVMLFRQDGYALILGVTAASRSEMYLPMFAEITKTFLLKPDPPEADKTKTAKTAGTAKP